MSFQDYETKAQRLNNGGGNMTPTTQVKPPAVPADADVQPLDTSNLTPTEVIERGMAKIEEKVTKLREQHLELYKLVLERIATRIEEEMKNARLVNEMVNNDGTKEKSQNA